MSNFCTVQDAKARFSEFLDTCIADGPQLVTKRGVEAAVRVPVAQRRRLQSAARPSLKNRLLSDLGRTWQSQPRRDALGASARPRQSMPGPISYRRRTAY